MTLITQNTLGIIVSAENHRGGLTVHYELRNERNTYCLLCLAFDRDGCCGFDYVFGIAESFSTASAIFDTVAENCVTPVSLREVLEDIL